MQRNDPNGNVLKIKQNLNTRKILTMYTQKHKNISGATLFDRHPIFLINRLNNKSKLSDKLLKSYYY